MKKEELKGIITYLEEIAKDLNVQKGNLYLSMQELKHSVNDWKRINHCNAFYSNSLYYDEEPFILVKSYNTIVAIYFSKMNLLISLGRFSITTYQHIRKFRNNYTLLGYNAREINLELVNWFK